MKRKTPSKSLKGLLYIDDCQHLPTPDGFELEEFDLKGELEADKLIWKLESGTSEVEANEDDEDGGDEDAGETDDASTPAAAEEKEWKSKFYWREEPIAIQIESGIQLPGLDWAKISGPNGQEFVLPNPPTTKKEKKPKEDKKKIDGDDEDDDEKEGGSGEDEEGSSPITIYLKDHLDVADAKLTLTATDNDSVKFELTGKFCLYPNRKATSPMRSFKLTAFNVPLKISAATAGSGSGSGDEEEEKEKKEEGEPDVAQLDKHFAGASQLFSWSKAEKCFMIAGKKEEKKGKGAGTKRARKK